jgi:17beta-estradiol 17-dehydrogenase / very-long-chain 3-oxoacyl-CoA reductase
MVTGASEGIGEEYAVELAKSGFNLVLISRTQANLEKVAEKARQANPLIET